MAIICRPSNLLFIMTPRTACTALGALLCSNLGGEYIPRKDILRTDGTIRIQRKHSTIPELLEAGLLSQQEMDSLLKFCVVRNPFDSLVSLYVKKRYKYQPLLQDLSSWVHRHPHYATDMKFARNHSFHAWLLRNTYRKIIKRMLGLPVSMYQSYTRGVDVVLRYERLQEDFNCLLRKGGIGRDLKIPIINRTTERDEDCYRSYYSYISRLAVEIAYRDDLEMFGYAFEG